MRNLNALRIVFVSFSMVSGTLQAQLGTNWFINNLIGMVALGNSREYDFMVSMAFIKKQMTTASFSPICSYLNVLLQCLKGEFGETIVDKSEEQFKLVVTNVKNMDRKKFRIANACYKNSTVSKKIENKGGYLFKLFFKKDASVVHRKHCDWFKSETKGLLSTPLTLNNFKNENSIYTSIVFFKDKWDKKFNKRHTKQRDFTLSNGTKTTLKLMKSKHSYRHKVLGEENKKFRVVALPYKETEEETYTRYIVYLIPYMYNADICDLWDSFYSYSKGNIKDVISDLKLKKMKLYIPKIIDLKSEIRY